MQVKQKPPKYIRLGSETGTAMKLTQKQQNWGDPKAGFHYWRDAGIWGIDFRFDEVEQKWKSHWPEEERLHNLTLIPITKKEWKEDNKGYV